LGVRHRRDNSRRREKSQRDFIIQPGVAVQRLRRETNHKMKTILKELNRCARNGDATALRLENILGRLTQGSAGRATLG
jgi:hypothetical protein